MLDRGDYMSFSPVEASKVITEKYKRYLSTIFEINDGNYEKQFIEALNNDGLLARGPFLDVTDAFVKGSSINSLIKTGELSGEFKNINMPIDRPLYKHQEEAIIKVQKGKNIVVSTGTGSGKTECFLIPIFNYLLRQHENRQLGPGVRALIIYPMNALANDQVERLRGLLANYPKITYGCYTGQTKHKFNDALVEYKKLNNDENPLKNELISREQMKESPPNILITNYAMLEYLMIRPDDNVFFDGEFSADWKFIILDEAHVYYGSTGIEVSMLLRRLKAKLRKNDINYILTSATLGGENDNKEVVEFARNLCDSVFNEDDVVRAKRIKLTAKRELETLPISFYKEISNLIEKKENEKNILHIVCDKIGVVSKGSLYETLYDIVLHDQNYWDIRRHLKATKPVIEISNLMKWSQQEVENFVTVASKCELNGDRLFDARYHMFLRATESVFITLKPSYKLFLTRKQKHFDENVEYKVFEIATCSFCHAIYIIGRIENRCLVQSNIIDEDEIRSVFLLADSISDNDEDYLLDEENIDVTEYKLCSRCGFIQREDLINGDTCEHGDDFVVKVFGIRLKNESGTLTKCLSCENTNSFGVLRMFFSGQEAATSVIGTALFEELPSYIVKKEIINSDDDLGFDFGRESAIESKTNIAKQFIAFSDNRQAAAFYSSYLDQTYRNILYKRLIVETLKDEDYRIRGKRFKDFIEDLVYQFEKHKIVGESVDSTRKEAWKAALHEIVDNNGKTSLYSMGLLGFSLNGEELPPNNKLNLKATDVATICSVFAMGMMADAAISYTANLNFADKEYFTHNAVEYSYTLSDPDPKVFKRSFIPVRMTNKRLDYLERVLKKAGNDISIEISKEILEKGFWKIFCSFGFLKAMDGRYRIDLEKIDVIKHSKCYICSKCKKVTIHNAFGVCPSFKCDGELIEIDVGKSFKNNHYFRMYQELDIRDLRVVEHTAQLSREMAYEYQKKFKQKEIDVLSCSTTFEMGVDVGSLETIFMRNMPPSPSNYAQRAGRAGRSKHSSAYAVTFCNKSSHDFSFFKSPGDMIKGRIEPPKFNIENVKIAIRHLYASALAFFWRENPEFFSKVDVMAGATEQCGYEVFYQYLLTKPQDLKKYIRRFLPESLVTVFKVDDYGWIASLMSKDKNNEGVFTKAVNEYKYEVDILNEAINMANAEGRKSDGLRERVRVYKNEDILSFLSRKNVLPKYGFPVDTVEMTIIDKTNKSRLGLQLQRDLSMAISEYAPDSQIVANGNLITSRYIRKIPNMNWKQYDYVKCSKCNTLNIGLHIGDINSPALIECKQCGEPFDKSKKYTFLIPQFGFEADGDSIKRPGLKKPERTYRGDVSYVGYNNEIEKYNYKIGKATFEVNMSQSDEMAVLNESNFFVCEHCGYSVLDDKDYKRSKKRKHKTPSGYWCRNDGTNMLKRFSLGYRFETDVVQLKFLNPDLVDKEAAMSVLQGVLRGTSRYLNIEQNDISGCLQYFFNDVTRRQNYALILYDKTPGGAGHVRRLNNEKVLVDVLRESLKLVEDCDCGGDEKDSSCYSCLRCYSNQNQHDKLKRKYVIDFLKSVFE